jgi:hypothetical protein
MQEEEEDEGTMDLWSMKMDYFIGSRNVWA